MKPEAEWYLVEALANARAEAGVRDDYDAKRNQLSAFSGILGGFRYLDVITEDEQRDWHRKMLVALGYEPPDPPPPGVTRAISVGDPRKRLAEPPEPESAPQFIRSHPGPDEEFEVHGGRFRVIAVEVYDTAIVVRWRAAPEPDISLAFPAEAAALEADVSGLEDWAAGELRKKADQRMRTRRLYRFDLADDVGTTYFQMGRRSGGGPQGITGEAEFRPAPPSSATKLVLSWLGLEVALPFT